MTTNFAIQLPRFAARLAIPLAKTGNGPLGPAEYYQIRHRVGMHTLVAHVEIHTSSIYYYSKSPTVSTYL